LDLLLENSVNQYGFVFYPTRSTVHFINIIDDVYSGENKNSVRPYMKSFILMFLVIAAAATVVNGAEISEIELNDGSVITGEIDSFSGGVYTVRSAALGTIQIEESKIRTIRKKSATGTARDTAGQIKSFQDKMLDDPETMQMIQSLQNDPDFQNILQDPEIMRAIQNNDMATLMANPQFMGLLNKQTVQEIKNRATK
jgi:hypothetical protein